jgi:hypothetical protein
MPGKPYQSMLIPYEEEILGLRKQRPPVAYARIAELLKEKYQISIQRAAIFKFMKVRSRWKRQEAREKGRGYTALNTVATCGSRPLSTSPLRNDAVRPNSEAIDCRQPWLGRQKERPASTGKILKTFTPSNEYNLTRLTPEEAAAFVEELRRERNGG